jgi:hypothetical protein
MSSVAVLSKVGNLAASEADSEAVDTLKLHPLVQQDSDFQEFRAGQGDFAVASAVGLMADEAEADLEVEPKIEAVLEIGEVLATKAVAALHRRVGMVVAVVVEIALGMADTLRQMLQLALVVVRADPVGITEAATADRAPLIEMDRPQWESPRQLEVGMTRVVAAYTTTDQAVIARAAAGAMTGVEILA